MMTHAASRLTLALVLGLVVLDVMSQLTGQFFSFNLQKVFHGSPLTGAPSAYVKLYGGQEASFGDAATQAAVGALSGAAGAAAVNTSQSPVGKAH